MQERGNLVKKLGVYILGTILLLPAFPVKSARLKKIKNFECYSDKRVLGIVKKREVILPEYFVTITDLENREAHFVAKKNELYGREIRIQTLTDEDAQVEYAQKYLTIQGREWALAIAPEKERASLYSRNPDVNEVPMFCLSLGEN